MSLLSMTCTVTRPLATWLDWLQSPFNLFVRVWVAKVFFESGLTKIQSWDTTIALFTHEYHVPLLSPTLAAFLGTGAELVLPVLLVAGLGTRFAAATLFVFNIVAVISYPDLNEIGIKDHQVWGILLLLPLLYGPGKLALDHWLCRKRQA